MKIHKIVEKPIHRLVYLAREFSSSCHVEDVEHYANLAMTFAGTTDVTYYRLALKYLAAYARLCWGDLHNEEKTIIEFLEGVNDFLRQTNTKTPNEGDTDNADDDTDEETE